MNVFCVTSAMRMAMRRFGGNDVELAMPDTAFGHQALPPLSDRDGRVESP